MLVSSKTTRPISFFFFTKRSATIIQAIPKIINQKYRGVKLREPKNQMLGTMEPPLCSWVLTWKIHNWHVIILNRYVIVKRNVDGLAYFCFRQMCIFFFKKNQMGHFQHPIRGVDRGNYHVFWSTASHDINAVYSVENIRVSSIIKLTMWYCAKSHSNYLVYYPERLIFNLLWINDV